MVESVLLKWLTIPKGQQLTLDLFQATELEAVKKVCSVTTPSNAERALPTIGDNYTLLEFGT